MKTTFALQDDSVEFNKRLFSPYKESLTFFIQEDPQFLLSLTTENQENSFFVLEELKADLQAIITSDFEKRIVQSHKPYCMHSVKASLERAKLLEDENIAKVYHYEEQDGDLQIHYEYTNNTTYFSQRIYNELNVISNEMKLRAYFNSFFEGIQYIHDRGLVHLSLDLNCLELHKEDDSRIVKIGSPLTMQLKSQQMSNELRNYLKKLLPLSPPELAVTHNIDPSFDIFCAGVIAYEICTCQLPESNPRAMKLILQRFVSKKLVKLITLMLEQNPVDRPTIQQVLDDEWFVI